MKSLTKYYERRDEASLFAKAMSKRALERSAQSVGEENYAYALGYLESVLSQVAASSPAALKALKEAMKY
jgi:hypothetical protein